MFKKKEKQVELHSFDFDKIIKILDEYQPSIFDKIRWKYKKVYNFIRKIPHGIKNIIRWFPIIWEDAEFDQTYLFDIMLFKFKNMEEFYRSGHTMSADALIYADDIKKAKELIQYIRDEQYEDDAFKPYYDKPDHNNEESHKLFVECHEESERLYREKMKEFCNIFTERVRYWWD